MTRIDNAIVSYMFTDTLNHTLWNWLQEKDN